MNSLKFNEICEQFKHDSRISRILNIIGLSIDKSKYEETYIFSNNLEQYAEQDAYLEDLIFYFVDDSCLYKAFYNDDEKRVNINKIYLKNIKSVDLYHNLNSNEVELVINLADGYIILSNLDRDVTGKWLSKGFRQELYNVIIDIYSKI